MGGSNGKSSVPRRSQRHHRSDSLTAFDGMLTYMQQHSGAWQGVTYWAGGPWWGDYMFSIEPQNGIDKPQMAVLLQHVGAPGGNYNGTSAPTPSARLQISARPSATTATTSFISSAIRSPFRRQR